MQNSVQDRTARLIADLWLKSQPQVRQRVAVLEAAAAAAQIAPLSNEQRAEAESIAHKLAGSLGMFGFPAGTEAARAYEVELHAPAPDPAKLTELAATLRATLFPEN